MTSDAARGPSWHRAACGAVAFDLLLLWSAKAAIGLWALHRGFSHVSDDDYARTVIAEQFAHAPRLDPSGTSWLPLPFWVTGTAMVFCGRSLRVARVSAVVLGTVTVAAPYAAMRAVHVQRVAAVTATIVAMTMAWNVWLGVAMVPEAWAGALGAAAAIGMASEGARPMCAIALLAAALCRYEAWPACAMFATLCAGRTFDRSQGKKTPGKGWRNALWAAIALAGPASWMAWNAYSHGSASHFLTRVAAFRRTSGAARVPLRDKVLGYPWALATQSPEAVALGGLGTLGVCLAKGLRQRWGWSALTALAVLAFLIVGDVRDGAPTHHPERALCIVWWVLVGMGVDAIGLAADRWNRSSDRRVATAPMAVLALGWYAHLFARRPTPVPGSSDWDRRDVQVARGLEMRSRRVESAVVTPCAFEHFALIAAWGAPERALLNPPLEKPPTADCPRVEDRTTGPKSP